MHPSKSVAKIVVGVLRERVKIGADGAGEKDRILRYDREAASQVMQLDPRDVDTVDVHATLSCL